MFLAMKKKRTKILINTLLISIVGCVALGRMISGAHYLSDVFLGGTITYLYYCLVFNVFKYTKINNRLGLVFKSREIYKIIIVIAILLICLFIGLIFQIC
jgi:membrane-associated phospholipid phosphatase